jgi:RNA-binding protein
MSNKVEQDTKRMRAIGHKLKPVVIIAGKGLTEGVMAEIERALTDHELIKIKLAADSREARAELTKQISARTGATLVQCVGHVALLVRRSAKPDPRLSNLIKPL